MASEPRLDPPDPDDRPYRPRRPGRCPYCNSYMDESGRYCDNADCCAWAPDDVRRDSDE